MSPDTIFNVHLHSRRGTFGLYKVYKGKMYLQTRHYRLTVECIDFKDYQNTQRNINDVLDYPDTVRKLWYFKTLQEEQRKPTTREKKELFLKRFDEICKHYKM